MPKDMSKFNLPPEIASNLAENLAENPRKGFFPSDMNVTTILGPTEYIVEGLLFPQNFP